jgi:hypothetical protein
MLDRREMCLHVDRHLRAALATMPTRLHQSFTVLLESRGLLTAGQTAYFGPLGHPVVELPVWVASSLADEGVATSEEVVADMLGVSILGYLHVRAQDDWLDGPRTGDPTLIALAESLMARCNRLLVPAVGGSVRFWDLHAEIVNAYAESLLKTHELRAGGAPVTWADFEQLLAQSRPLVLPSAALLDRADQWQLLPALEEFVFTTTAVAQLVNDLTDLFRDRRNGHRTWTADSIGESAVDTLWTDVAGPIGPTAPHVVQDRVAEALALHERSVCAAHALVSTTADGWLADRRAVLEGLAGDLHEGLLSAFMRQLSIRAREE